MTLKISVKIWMPKRDIYKDALMPFLMLILQCQVSNNYWKVDYDKQKRAVTIFANAKDRPCYLRGRNSGLLYQPSEIVV